MHNVEALDKVQSDLAIASLSKQKNCYKVNKFLDIIRNNHLVFLPIIRTKTTILIALSRLWMCLTSPLNGIKS